MARIRSVHPGLFTDEAFARLSDAAQVFLIGIWTEADDQGVFEWKPLTLKMRIRPASLCPVEPLLEELKAGNCVTEFSLSGRLYGVIRNFRRFQRPKKPNLVHVLPEEFRTYVGLNDNNEGSDNDLSASGSEPVPPKAEPVPVIPMPVPPKSEIPPQMEDEGGRKEDGNKEDGDLTVTGDKSPRVPSPLPEAVEIWNEVCGSVLTPVRRLTEQRKRKFSGRWKSDFESNMAVWRDFCAAVVSSNFLTGSGEKGWRADFDWVLEPKNTTKILEGGYVNRAGNGGHSTRRKTSGEEWADRLGIPNDDDNYQTTLEGFAE